MKYDMLINTLLESPDVIAIRGAKIPYSQSKYTFVIANGCVVYTDAKSMYHAQMLNLVQKNLFYAQGDRKLLLSSLSQKHIYMLDPNSTFTNSAEFNDLLDRYDNESKGASEWEKVGLSGRLYEIDGIMYISFWEKQKSVLKQYETITKFLRYLNIDVDKVMWEIWQEFYPRETFLTTSEYTDRTYKQSAEHRTLRSE